MYYKKHIEKMEGTGFWPSLTRNMDGQNRRKRREHLQSRGYKVGAMVVIGTTRYRYRLQRVAGKKIYHLDEKGSNW